DFHVTGVQTCALPISITTQKYFLVARMDAVGFMLNRGSETGGLGSASSRCLPWKKTIAAIPAISRMILAMDQSPLPAVGALPTKIGRASRRERGKQRG